MRIATRFFDNLALLHELKFVDTFFLKSAVIAIACNLNRKIISIILSCNFAPIINVSFNEIPDAVFIEPSNTTRNFVVRLD